MFGIIQVLLGLHKSRSPKLVSGSENLQRPLSSGLQTYKEKPGEFPIHKGLTKIEAPLQVQLFYPVQKCHLTLLLCFSSYEEQNPYFVYFNCVIRKYLIQISFTKRRPGCILVAIFLKTTTASILRAQNIIKKYLNFLCYLKDQI